jgi:hypothetical protein
MHFTDQEANRLLAIFNQIEFSNPFDFGTGNIDLKKRYTKDMRDLSKELSKLGYSKNTWRRVENLVHKYFRKYGEYSKLLIESIINGLEDMDDAGFWSNPDMY